MTTCTLWGVHKDTHDIAKMLIDQHLNDDPYIRVIDEQAMDRIVSLTFHQRGEVTTDVYGHGIYIIWRKVGDSLQCMYVGETGADKTPCELEEAVNNIRNRIYRWFKELKKRSHPKESHPGARRAREKYGATVNDVWYMKIISAEKIDKMFSDNGFNRHTNIDLDEHIAEILGSLCNVKKKDQNKVSLVDFF